MKDLNLISIDIGNGYVKAMNMSEEKLHFPTVVVENQDVNIMGETKNKYKIRINSSEYYIGNLGIVKKGIRQWKNNMSINADTALYIALCSHLLTEDSKEDEIVEVNLCLGLPYNYYISLNKGEQILSNMSNKMFETVYNSQHKNIHINSISIYPQGVGAYFSHLYDIHGRAKKGAEKHIEALFIDIGFRTVDIVAFNLIDGNFELIQEDSFSLQELGMFQAVNYISQKIQSQVEVNSNDIEFALQNRNGIIENMYETIDIKPLSLIAYEQLSKKILNQINLRLSGEIERYKDIYLTGGAAEKLYPYMKKNYPNLQLQEDFVFCNTKGYLALQNTK